MPYPQLNYGIDAPGVYDAGMLGNVWQPPIMMADAGIGAGYFSGRPTQRPAYPDYYFPGYGSDVTGDYIRKTFGPWYGAEKADALAQTPWVRQLAMAPVVSFSGGPDTPSPLAQAMQTGHPAQALARYDQARMEAGRSSPTQGGTRQAQPWPFGDVSQQNSNAILQMMGLVQPDMPLTQRIAMLGGGKQQDTDFLSGLLKGLFKGNGGGAMGGGMGMG